MPVSFGNIPPDVLLPLFYAEVTSAAEPVSPSLRLCLIGAGNLGEAYGEGVAVPNLPYLMSDDTAVNLFGAGSMLHRMYQFARSNAPFAEIWGCMIPHNPPLDDGTEVSGRSMYELTIGHNGSKTFYGTATIWLEGVQINFPIGQTMTKDQIAAGLAQRINRSTAAATGDVNAGAHGFRATRHSGSRNNVVVLTTRYAGAITRQLSFSFSGCRGRADATSPNAILARRAITKIETLQLGYGEPNPNACFSVLQDRDFDVFCVGYRGPYFMMACEDFMDHISGRWAPNRQMYGHMVTAHRGNWQTQFDLHEPETDPHMSSIAIKNSVIPPWCWASALGGTMVTHWSAPPELSRPLQTLELRNCCVGSDDDESFTRVEKQTLLRVGASTFSVDDVNTVRIDRVRTLRKENVYGDPDAAWADAVTMFQAMYFVRQMRAAIQGAYPRCALSTLPTGINGFTSPVEIRALVIHEYKRLAGLGLVENADLFSRYLVVERNGVDRNRVDCLMRPDFINQLRVVAALVETHLELDATDPTLLQASTSG